MSGDAGKLKNRDNEIIEIRPDGERVVRFVPTSAAETPWAVERLCLEYQEAVEQESLPELLIIGSFILDFLCIHPFRDGNGRVSRLLSTLLLERHGFAVATFISLERLIEENRDSYYRSLYESSQGWHDSDHDIVPWWNYFLSVINSAYREFSEAVESREAGPGKTELVREVIMETKGEFSLSEIRAQLPSVSEQLIKRVLQQMKSDGYVRLTGRGRGARWERVD
jgi:Fic family protein